jgi:hypothetical protein
VRHPRAERLSLAFLVRGADVLVDAARGPMSKPVSCVRSETRPSR